MTRYICAQPTVTVLTHGNSDQRGPAASVGAGAKIGSLRAGLQKADGQTCRVLAATASKQVCNLLAMITKDGALTCVANVRSENSRRWAHSRSAPGAIDHESRSKALQGTP